MTNLQKLAVYVIAVTIAYLSGIINGLQLFGSISVVISSILMFSLGLIGIFLWSD